MKAAETQGVSTLIREAALDLGHLVGQHVKLAQLELKAELRAVGRRVAIMATLVALVVLGYGLAMAGLAAVIGGNLAVGVPLVTIGLIHVAGAGLGLVLAAFRMRGPPLMNTSTTAMTRSLEALEGKRHAP